MTVIPASLHRLLANLAWGTTVLMVFVLQFNVGTPPEGANLDASWSAVLAWGWHVGAAWGRDIVFTYGPLGFLYPGASYYGPMFTAFFLGQVILGLIISVALVHAAREQSWAVRLTLLAVFVAGWLPWLSPDVLWFLFLGTSLIATVSQGARAGESTALTAIACVYAGGAAALGLIKFSLLPLALLWLVCISVSFVRRGNRLGATLVVTVYAIVTATLWMTSGQQIGGAAEYVATSLEISKGYADAMGIVPRLRTDVVGFLLMAGAGGWLALQALWQRRAPERALLFFFLGCILYFAWRSAYTRADGHIVILYPVAFFLVLGSLAVIPSKRAGLLQGGGIAGVVLASAFAYWVLPEKPSLDLWTGRWTQIPHKLHALSDPSYLRANREAQRVAATEKIALPKVRALVGADAVDILSWDQGVLLLNGLSYRPRPVFQGYSAYTPSLLRRNESFFLGRKAPRWVLLRLQAIDNRLPMSDDALSLIAILRRYRPVIEESGYMLWERTDLAISPLGAPNARDYRTIATGEWANLPTLPSDGVQVAFVKSERTWLGKLYAFWFRGSPLVMEVETSGGRLLSWRLIPAAGESGFILSPLLLDNNDLLDWYTRSGNVIDVARIRVRPALDQHRPFFESEFRVAFKSVTLSRPPFAQMPRELVAVAAAGFSPVPSAREGMIQRVVEDAQPSLFMHSPASLRFAIAAGAYKIDGTFGIQGSAIASPGCEVADGVRLALYARSKSERSLLHARDINPFKRPAERGAQNIKGLKVDLPAEAELELAIEPGLAGANTACDWAYVRDFKIKRIRMIDGTWPPIPHDSGAAAPPD